MLAPADLFDFRGSLIEELFTEVTMPWDPLGRIKKFLADRVEPAIHGAVHPTAVIEGAVFIDEGAKVEPGAYIQGPCWIGKGSQVRQGAYIRGSVYVGEKCVVGHVTEVKNSLFLDGAKAGHFAYVGDSILGKGVNLGAGTKLANFRLDAGNILLNVDGESVDTGLRKFGALLGDDVQTGCNSVTSPGTVIGRKSWIYSNTTVPKGIYEAGKIILNKERRLITLPQR